MDKKLDASSFALSPEIYEAEFKIILSAIIFCYQMMAKDKISVPNDENKIRDILYNKYLNNDKIRNVLNLTHYLFDCEVAEYDKDESLTGYLDYKISTQNTFVESNSYYIIECKRLDSKNLTGDTGLNAKYIKDGMMRFVTGQYSSHHGINGMIAFVVEQINISDNVKNINRLLSNSIKSANTKKVLTFVALNSFKYSYYSEHKDNTAKKIKLFHLMFDFSKNLLNKEHL